MMADLYTGRIAMTFNTPSVTMPLVRDGKLRARCVSSGTNGCPACGSGFERMPDPATASAALQNGEIDWWELVIPDLAPALRKNRNVVVDIADPMGAVAYLVMNHLHPAGSPQAARPGRLADVCPQRQRCRLH
jgi:hypothetical protein